MKTLDCESIESAYRSLETILGINECGLRELFDSVDSHNGEFHKNPGDFLLSHLQQKTGCKTQFGATCWFHVIRTWPDNMFDDGILPLNQAINHIWNFLFALVKGELTSEQWKYLRSSIFTSDYHFADLYKMKRMNAEIHGGPFAFLVRQIALACDDRYHNYLTIPEIAEDICLYCQHIFKLNLRERYINSTVPCIIKFIDHIPKTNALGTALLYTYNHYQGSGLSEWCNLSFSGQGKPIPKDRILKVEFLRENEIKSPLSP